MLSRLAIIIFFSAIVMSGVPAAAQAPQQTPGGTPSGTARPSTERVVGEVTAVDAANKSLTLKNAEGKSFSVRTDERTVYRRVPAGETTLEKAVAITLADIGVGDRVIARGKLENDKLAAQALIVVSSADLAQKEMREKAEWKKRGIQGTVVGINPMTEDIMVRVLTPSGPVPIRVTTQGRNVRYRRYGPDAVKFSDAKPSSFEELRGGDQVRALGDKSPDGTRFFPEEIVSGSFQMAGGIITAVNAATGEVQITNAQTKKPLTVVIGKDAKVRRLPPELLKQMEQTMASNAAASPAPGEIRMLGGPPGGGPPPSRPAPSEPMPDGGRVPSSAVTTPTPRQGQTPVPQGEIRMAGQPGGAPSPGGPRPVTPSADYGEAIENLPPITVADLKPGDGIIISSTKGADPSRATAILVAAGVEGFLKRQEENAKRPGVPLDLALPGLGGP